MADDGGGAYVDAASLAKYFMQEFQTSGAVFSTATLQAALGEWEVDAEVRAKLERVLPFGSPPVTLEDAAPGGPADCSVCFESSPRVRMPCCYRRAAASGLCQACVEELFAEAGVGNCPLCRSRVALVDRQLFCLRSPQDTMAARAAVCYGTGPPSDTLEQALIDAGVRAVCGPWVVRLRHCPELDAMTRSVVRPGDSLLVMGRADDWIRTAAGWLPLRGRSEQSLFRIDWGAERARAFVRKRAFRAVEPDVRERCLRRLQDALGQAQAHAQLDAHLARLKRRKVDAAQ